MNSKTHRAKLAALGLVLVVLVLGVTALLFSLGSRHGHYGKATPAEQLYTCGMHPEVIRKKPGNCPICGMKLTPIRQQPGSTAMGTNSAAAGNGERKIKSYKSSMLLGEV